MLLHLDGRKNTEVSKWKMVYGLWCLKLPSIFFSYILAVSFIGGGNRNTGIKTTDLSPSNWQTLSHNVVSSTPCHERGSNNFVCWIMYAYYI